MRNPYLISLKLLFIFAVIIVRWHFVNRKLSVHIILESSQNTIVSEQKETLADGKKITTSKFLRQHNSFISSFD